MTSTEENTELTETMKHYSFYKAVSLLKSDINSFISLMDSAISLLKKHEYNRRTTCKRARQIATLGLTILDGDIPTEKTKTIYTSRYLYAHRLIQARRQLQEAQNLVELEILTSTGAWK